MSLSEIRNTGLGAKMGVSPIKTITVVPVANKGIVKELAKQAIKQPYVNTGGWTPPGSIGALVQKLKYGAGSTLTSSLPTNTSSTTILKGKQDMALVQENAVQKLGAWNRLNPLVQKGMALLQTGSTIADMKKSGRTLTQEGKTALYFSTLGDVQKQAETGWKQQVSLYDPLAVRTVENIINREQVINTTNQYTTVLEKYTELIEKTKEGDDWLGKLGDNLKWILIGGFALGAMYFVSKSKRW